MNAFKLGLLALATALLGAAVFTATTAIPPGEQLRDRAGFSTIDEFLSDSRRYLGL